jgi:hypothetical protein
VALIAGTQGGKTSYGPWWLRREIQRRGGGDYAAVSANYDLFKLKMLPALLLCFEHILKVGRYWASDRVIEVCDPTGKFWARKFSDPMYARIILRSAVAIGGLESGTLKGLWLDEAGQDDFVLAAYNALRRRAALNRARFLLTTTLYNLGWIKQQVIDLALADGKAVNIYREGNGQIEITDNPKQDIALIQFDSTVNPIYPVAEFEDARRRLPDEDFKMFYQGQVARLRYLIYNCLTEERNICDPFPIPLAWPRMMGLDFGGAHTAAIKLAMNPLSGDLFGYAEYLAGEKTAAQHVTDLLSDEARKPFAAGGSHSEGQWRMEFEQAGLPVDEPFVSLVDIGIMHVYRLLKEGRLKFFRTLTGTLDQFGRYKRKRDKAGNILNEIEDKQTFHYLDAVRYIATWIVSELERVIEVGKSPLAGYRG